MTILGGFVHKVGLVHIGASTLEIDAQTTVFQPMGNHASNKPLSLNWYFPLEFRDPNSSDSNNTNRHYCHVKGKLKDCSINVVTSDTDGTRLIDFRVNGAGTTVVTVTGGTTGVFTGLDVDVEFDKGARVNYRYYNGDASSGNLTFQCTSVIVWE